MKQYIKNNIVIILSLIIIISGLLVMTGWIFGISFLKSFLKSWVTMKFDTAIAFVLSGVILYYINMAVKGEFDLAQIVISIATLIIILLMGVIFFASLFGVQTGAEELFVKEAPGTIKTVIPGRPSALTIINFLLVSAAGILTILKYKKITLTLKIIGIFITCIGASAVIGYIINFPLLYYYIKDINSAMAFNTAILFVLLGAGFICLSE